MEQVLCNKGGLVPQNQPGGRGSQKREKEPGMEPGIFLFFGGKCSKAGDGSLHTGGGQRVADGKYRKDQLVDSHAFRTQSLGQEYLIEESKKTA